MKEYLNVIKLVYAFIVVALAISYSCEKDNNNNNIPIVKSATEYYPLKEGNYWIYDIHYEVYDYLNSEITYKKLDYQDTMTVTGSELTDGWKYYTLLEKAPVYSWQFHTRITADSAGYLMSNGKNRFFSNVNFTDSIISTYLTSDGIFGLDTIFYIRGIMERINTPYTCAAGTFSDILNMHRDVLVWNKPLNEDYPNQNPTVINTYYAKNVGIIYHTSVTNQSSRKTEWRLAKYCIDGVVYPKE